MTTIFDEEKNSLVWVCFSIQCNAQDGFLKSVVLQHVFSEFRRRRIRNPILCLQVSNCNVALHFGWSKDWVMFKSFVPGLNFVSGCQSPTQHNQRGDLLFGSLCC